MHAKGLPEGSKTFQLLAGSKRPAGGAGHLDATAEHVPVDNYGISLDNQFLVVDIDDPDKVPKEFRDRLSELPTWNQKTRRGEHFLFKVPEGFKGTNAKLPGNSGDLKVHGYIVGPGSEVEGHVYTVRDSTEPAPAPEWLLGLLLEKHRPLQELRQMASVETSLLLKEGEGRNEFLVRVAGLLRGQGLGVDQVKEAVRRVNDIVCNPPVHESELRSTIDKSIAKWEQGVVDVVTGILPANMRQASGVELIREPLSYMIRPLIPKIGMTLMHGIGSVGKSTFASFVTAQATKREVRVLLLCSEEDPVLHIQRAVHMGADPDYIYWPDPQKVRVNSLKFPKNAPDLDVLISEIGIGFVYIDAIQTHADPSTSKNMHAGEKARVLVAEVAALAIKHSIPILGTFHNNKGSDTAQGSEELANTARQQLSLTTAGTGEAKRLSIAVDKSNGPDDGKIVQFTWSAKEFTDPSTGNFQKEIVEDDIDADEYREGFSEVKDQKVPFLTVVKHSAQTVPTDDTEAKPKDACGEAVLSLLEHGNYMQSSVLKDQAMTLTGAGKSTIERTLADLVDNGLVATEGTAKYTRYRKINFVVME